jgi:hypothetical protein
MYIFFKNLSTKNILDLIFYRTLFYDSLRDVAEEVKGCSSGGRDDIIARQGIRWIVVQADPDNNDLHKWQCNVGSCCFSYASKLRLQGHMMAGHPCQGSGDF